MAGRYLPLVATTALLTAAASVAQPQTTTGTSTDAPTTTTDSSTQTTPAAADTTTGISNSATRSPDRDQSSTTGTTATPTGNDPATTTGSAAAAGASTMAADANSLQGQDAQFLRQAMESDRMEIASAQAALANAERSETKTAAQMLLQDHQQSSQKLQQLASRKGWPMPVGISSAESDQARMTSAGAGFDDRFMAEQIRMHRDAIALFRQQVASGSDPDLRQFASEQLPHLEHHLEMLQGSHTRK